MIRTIKECYQAVLLGIRMEKTSTVEPDEFNLLWNESTVAWQGIKLPSVEFNQKRIDDLQQFYVITDGSSIGFPLIRSIHLRNTFQVPITFKSIAPDGLILSEINKVEYPMYRHGLNVFFKEPDTEKLFPVYLMRSDKRAVTMVNPYREVKKSRPYFEYRNNHITLEGRDSEYMCLGYIRYPKIAEYFEDESKNVDPETTPAQNEEIVQLAVSMFLENKGNPRYKTQLQQMMLRSQGS